VSNNKPHNTGTPRAQSALETVTAEAEWRRLPGRVTGPTDQTARLAAYDAPTGSARPSRDLEPLRALGAARERVQAAKPVAELFDLRVAEPRAPGLTESLDELLDEDPSPETADATWLGG
jgi:hypothetical protein